MSHVSKVKRVALTAWQVWDCQAKYLSQNRTENIINICVKKFIFIRFFCSLPGFPSIHTFQWNHLEASKYNYKKLKSQEKKALLVLLVIWTT